MEVDDAKSSDGDLAPNATVYVRNINERVKIPALVEALRGIFTEFGEIQDIVAKRSLKRKGQAFVIFDDIESAQNAIDAIDGFEVFGQQLSCAFAKTKSDVTVKNEDGDEALEGYKKQRIAERERKEAEAKAAEAAKAAQALEQKGKKRDLDDEDDEQPERAVKQAKVSAASLVPDEYLPPNKTLTVRDLAPGVVLADLEAAFGHFPKFREARTVPNRPLAFIEFEDTDAAELAKRATADLHINGQRVVVNYRRG